MTANLTPQYRNAEAKFKSASTIEEKIDALEEMYRTIPKHKGTEKMCSDIKQRISKAKQEKEQAAKTSQKGISHHIPRAGSAQITLVGTPNTGKSSILKAFTNANPETADYPFTTQRAQPGMLKWENVNIQLIDLPPISNDYFEPWIPSLIRVSDMILFVVRLDKPEGLETILEVLKNYKIEPVNSIKELDNTDRIVHLPVTIVATFKDHTDSEIGLEILHEEYEKFDILPVTTTDSVDAELLGKHIMRKLNLIRVYTRAPGKTALMNKPVVIRNGSTLLDVAMMTHRDFGENLKYARVWGSAKYEGQRIQKDYIVRDGDILEFTV